MSKGKRLRDGIQLSVRNGSEDGQHSGKEGPGGQPEFMVWEDCCTMGEGTLFLGCPWSRLQLTVK